jgi:hypothetical protein
MAKAPKKTKEASDLRARVEAILHSNGFDGTKAAEEIHAAVVEHVGAVPADAEVTEE